MSMFKDQIEGDADAPLYGLKALETWKDTLQSPVKKNRWMKDEELGYKLDAQCQCDPFLGKGTNCNCGIHAGFTSNSLRDYFKPQRKGVALVLLEAWGRYVIHEQGWRAAHARVCGVVLPWADDPEVRAQHSVEEWDEAISVYREMAENLGTELIPFKEAKGVVISSAVKYGACISPADLNPWRVNIGSCVGCGGTLNDAAEEIDGEMWCEDCVSENWDICSTCREWVNREDVYITFDRAYCESCHDATFSSCEHCGEYYFNEDVHGIDMGEGDTLWLCEYCADEREDIVKCEWCSGYLGKDIAVPVASMVTKKLPCGCHSYNGPGIDYLCDNCKDNETYDCIECGMKSVQEGVCTLCEEVHGKPVPCSRCGDPLLEKNLVRLTENWAECPRCRHESEGPELWPEVHHDGL
jgi:hypothetical protein